MPEPFIEIAQIEKGVLVTSGTHYRKAKEKIFTTEATIKKFNLLDKEEQITFKEI